MENQNLFPEKDLIDLGFMDHIRFNSFVPVSKAEVDKAIHEYNCLKDNLRKLNGLYDKKLNQLIDQKEKVETDLNKAMEDILAGVKTCITDHTADFGIQYDEDNKCSLAFEHGSLILEEVVINKLKIKPKKEN